MLLITIKNCSFCRGTIHFIFPTDYLCITGLVKNQIWKNKSKASGYVQNEAYIQFTTKLFNYYKISETTRIDLLWYIVIIIMSGIWPKPSIIHLYIIVASHYGFAYSYFKVILYFPSKVLRRRNMVDRRYLLRLR